jgi:transcriptional regulator with XRE-family HTH domain
VGARIRSLRLDANLTQERLAERSGISRDSVIYAENGTKAASIDTLHLLARALGVPVSWLFVDDCTTGPGGGSRGGATPH